MLTRAGSPAQQSPFVLLVLPAPKGSLQGEVLVAEPRRRLSYSIHAGADQPRTYVTWGIVEDADESGSRVRLYVDETEIASHDDDEAENTWLLVIASLQRTLSSLPLE